MTRQRNSWERTGTGSNRRLPICPRSSASRAAGSVGPVLEERRQRPPGAWACARRDRRSLRTRGAGRPKSCSGSVSLAPRCLAPAPACRRRSATALPVRGRSRKGEVSKIFDREDLVGPPRQAQQHPETNQEDDDGECETQQVWLDPQCQERSVLSTDDTAHEKQSS